MNLICNKNPQHLSLLPIKLRIDFKILLLALKALNGLAPVYLTDLLMPYNPSRCLRSWNSGLLVVPWISKFTKEGRSFVTQHLWRDDADPCEDPRWPQLESTFQATNFLYIAIIMITLVIIPLISFCLKLMLANCMILFSWTVHLWNEHYLDTFTSDKRSL